jgi:hypothetical protein
MAEAAGAATAASERMSKPVVAMRWVVVMVSSPWLSIAGCDRIGENHELCWSTSGRQRSRAGKRVGGGRALRD